MNDKPQAEINTVLVAVTPDSNLSTDGTALDGVSELRGSGIGATSKPSWNHINHLFPKRFEYVLAHTPFCKYKCAVVFWNGVDWKSADDKDVVWNIEYWQHLPITEHLKPNDSCIFDKHLF